MCTVPTCLWPGGPGARHGAEGRHASRIQVRRCPAASTPSAIIKYWSRTICTQTAGGGLARRSWDLCCYADAGERAVQFHQGTAGGSGVLSSAQAAVG